MEIVHVIGNESSHSSWTELHWELGRTQEHELRGNPKFLRYRSEVDSAPFWRDSARETNWKCSSLMDEIYTVSWSCDQVDKAKVHVYPDSVLCVNSTPTSTERAELHSMITFHHAKLRIASLCPKNCCHPRVMLHSLPHLTASTSSLSPLASTSPIFPTVSPSQTRFMILDPNIHCDGPRQSGGSTQIPSLKVTVWRWWWWEASTDIASDTSKLERVFNFLEVSCSACFSWEERLHLSRRLRGRCCTQVTDVLALEMRFVCAAAAQVWSHDAFVSEHSKNKSPRGRGVRRTLPRFPPSSPLSTKKKVKVDLADSLREWRKICKEMDVLAKQMTAQEEEEEVWRCFQKHIENWEPTEGNIEAIAEEVLNVSQSSGTKRHEQGTWTWKGHRGYVNDPLLSSTPHQKKKEWIFGVPSCALSIQPQMKPTLTAWLVLREGRRALPSSLGWDQSHRDRSDRAWRPRAQKHWAGQESRDRSESNPGKMYEKFSYWRYGRIWKSWCRDVVSPVTDAFRLHTQRRALQTRTSKMENCEKCWLNHCICRIEKTMNPLECQSHLGNLLHCYRREEQVGSVLKLIWRKAWCQVHLRNREHRGNLAALFSPGNKEPGNQFKSSVFTHADPSNLGRSLLEGSKDHLFSQARSEVMKHQHQVGSLHNCISELQQQACAQRLELHDAHQGHIESRREQARLQEE